MSDTVKDDIPDAPPRKKFTKKEVEDFIVLSSQSAKPWFKLVMADKDMACDETAMALMEVLTNSIYEGMHEMAIQERMAQTKADSKKGIIL